MEKTWICLVCGYEHKGDKPLAICPRCSSGGGEFIEKGKNKFVYDNKKFDFLIINGSTHRSHNSGFITQVIESELKKLKVSYRIVNLNELKIKHCWCCYSMGDNQCTYPCRNQEDDLHILQDIIVNSKSLIIVSPINWNNMSARLKDFLDRMTSMQNQALLGKKCPVVGKTLGIIVNGHEDGDIKTCNDIFTYFEQMGMILAPYGYVFRTHGSEFNTNQDNDFFKKDEKIKKDIKNLVNNMLLINKLDLEKKLKGSIIPVSE